MDLKKKKNFRGFCFFVFGQLNVYEPYVIFLTGIYHDVQNIVAE